MSLAFLEPGASSEDLIEDAEVIEEVAPEVDAPSVAATLNDTFAKIKKAGEKTNCPECGTEVTVRGLTRHLNKAHGGAGAEEKTPKAPKDPNAPVKSRRVKADELMTTIVTGLAGLFVNAGISPAAGKALMLEASILGPEFDKAAAGTVVDRLALQPIMKAKGRWEGVANLAAFPVLCFAIDKQPNLFPVLYQPLRASMKGVLPQLVAGKRRQLQDERKYQEMAEELIQIDAELMDIEESRGPDPIDILIRSLFKMPEEEPVVVAEPGSAWDANSNVQ